jgi:chromosomal replication initiation ATPase DnaA
LLEALNQFPLEVFEHRTRSTAREVARRKQIIKTLRDIYKWSFPRIAELFQYSDHTTVMHLYNQR